MQLNFSKYFKSVLITCQFLIRSKASETELKTKLITNSRMTAADVSETNNLLIVCGCLFTLSTQPDTTFTLAISANIF